MNAVKYLIEYANKKRLLPLRGAELFLLQEQAYKLPETYSQDLNKLLIEKFGISLEQWREDTKYMGEHYFPMLLEKHISINNFIARYAKSLGGFKEARQINHFYSLLNQAVKRGQIKRYKKAGLYLYEVI